MICVRCGEKEERIKTRHLCLSCYRVVRNNGELCGYPKEDLFANKLFQKYGNGIMKDFMQVTASTTINLSDIAAKYGFSRERARQIYQELFGEPYTKSKNNKSKMRAARASRVRRDLSLRAVRYKGNVLKGVTSEFVIEQICRSLGYAVVANGHGQTIDLIINGKNVEVKSSHKLIFPPNSRCGYYKFHCRPNQRGRADYFILHIVPENRFFVVPCAEVHGDTVYVRPTNTRKRWNRETAVGEIEKYNNAWHLLSDNFMERATGSRVEAVMQ